MAVDDHGIEVLKKSGEEMVPGSKADYYLKTGLVYQGAPVSESNPLPVGATFSGTFTPVSPGGKPTIENITTGTAGTEFSYIIPDHTTKISIKSRKFSTILMAFNPGETDPITGTYFTISPGTSYSEDGLDLTGLVLYMQADKDDLVLEVLSWQSL